MKLRGRGVVVYGDFRTFGRKSGRRNAIRRLEALGAQVADSVTDRTDIIFLSGYERGPIPRTDKMLRTPYFSEDGAARHAGTRGTRRGRRLGSR